MTNNKIIIISKILGYKFQFPFNIPGINAITNQYKEINRNVPVINIKIICRIL